LSRLSLNVQLIGWIETIKWYWNKLLVACFLHLDILCFVGWWAIITSMVIFLMCHQHFKFWTYLRINLMEAFQHIIPQIVRYLSNICKYFQFSSLQNLKCLFIAMNLIYLKESFVDSFNKNNWKLKRTNNLHNICCNNNLFV
jgi:hypothetical protein